MENVGRTILNQMKTINQTFLWSWGSHAYKTFSSSNLPELGQHLGGLIFRVKGRKYRGNVIISLQGNDLYHIHLGQLRKGRLNIKTDLADIYVEDLMGILDELVET
jgi:hypothetical protein